MKLFVVFATIALCSNAVMANHLVNSDTHVPFREYGLPEIQQDRFVISIPEAPAALPLPELSIPIIQTVFLPPTPVVVPIVQETPAEVYGPPIVSVPVTERIYVAPPEAPALPELPPVVQPIKHISEIVDAVDAIVNAIDAPYAPEVPVEPHVPASVYGPPDVSHVSILPVEAPVAIPEVPAEVYGPPIIPAAPVLPELPPVVQPIIPEVPVVDAPYAPAVPVVEVAAGIPAAVYGPPIPVTERTLVIPPPAPELPELPPVVQPIFETKAVVDAPYAAAVPEVPAAVYGPPIVPVTERIYVAPPPAPLLPELPPVVRPIVELVKTVINSPYPAAVPEVPATVYGPPIVETKIVVDAPYPAAVPEVPAAVYGPPTVAVTERIYVAPPPAPLLPELPPVVQPIIEVAKTFVDAPYPAVVPEVPAAVYGPPIVPVTERIYVAPPPAPLLPELPPVVQPIVKTEVVKTVVNAPYPAALPELPEVLLSLVRTEAPVIVNAPYPAAVTERILNAPYAASLPIATHYGDPVLPLRSFK